MIPYLKEFLSAASIRKDSKKMGSSRQCKLCGDISIHFCATDFNKSCNHFPLPTSNISVEYFKCQNCELIFTDFCDDWSHNEFQEIIYNNDYLLVDPEYNGVRSTADAELFGNMLAPLKGIASILDYGGGMGVFAREMERHGFTGAQSYDPFGINQILSANKFDMVTAFEVLVD